jgi:hypothetical protein
VQQIFFEMKITDDENSQKHLFINNLLTFPA